MNPEFPQTKLCPKCQLVKPLSEFYPDSSKSGGYRSDCKICHRANRKAWRATPEGKEASARWKASPEGIAKQRANEKRQNQRHKESRKSGLEPERWIVYYSRKSDKKRGLVNDLTKEMVREIINRGCYYCGSHIKMTLDRIDNSLGHTISNVVPACFRCNTIRGPMPMEAWLEVVENGLKSAINKGLLNDWGLDWKSR